MKKRGDVATRVAADASKAPPVKVPHDPFNESVLLAAMLVDSAACSRVLAGTTSQLFLGKGHAAIYEAVKEARRRNLKLDPATIRQIGGSAVDERYVKQLVAAHPKPPPNLSHHLQTLVWDTAKAKMVEGPLAALHAALSDPLEDPERVKALTRQVGRSLDNQGMRRAYVWDSAALVAEAMRDIDERIAGRACYPYGIDGLDYYPDGRPRMTPGAKRGETTLISAISGGGKALALDTPIATPYGWSAMGDLDVGDELFDETGAVCRVEWVSEVRYDRECFEIEFSDGARIVADADHQWLTMTAQERRAAANRMPARREKNRRVRAEKLGYVERRLSATEKLIAFNLNRRDLVSISGSVRTTREIADSIGDPIESRRVAANHSISVAGDLQLPLAELPLDPYVLGVWLGDGTTAGGSITSADDFVVAEIARAGFVVRRSRAAYRWGVLGLTRLLREVGVLDDKHVPSEYMRASVEQRLALLQGLLDTDGYAKPSGGVEFVNTNERLAKAVRELVNSLGMQATMTAGRATLNGNDCGPKWTVRFAPNRPVFRLPRKLARTSTRARRPTTGRRYIVAVRSVPPVPVRCIGVSSPSKLFLAGREMIPTHNSTVVLRMVLGFVAQQRKVLLGSWEMGSPLSLELLATFHLGRSRTAMSTGKITKPERDQHRQAMEDLTRYVDFWKFPWSRGLNQRPKNNDEVVDKIHGHISDSGCEVVVFDMLRRAFVDRRLDAEERAVEDMQSVVQETMVHGVFVHQQRLKDIEKRKDPRPTREGVKGTSIWVEMPDTIIGTHLPGHWKKVAHQTMQFHVMKQRNGPWPLGVEFDWDGEYGTLENPQDFDVEARAEDGDKPHWLDED